MKNLVAAAVNFQVLQIILDLEMMRSHLCVGLLLLFFVEIFSPAKFHIFYLTSTHLTTTSTDGLQNLGGP